MVMGEREKRTGKLVKGEEKRGKREEKERKRKKEGGVDDDGRDELSKERIIKMK